MSAVCVWDFTLKEDAISRDNLLKKIKEHCKKWCFQLEEGESGYRHYQGRISLKMKKRLNEITKAFDVKEIHWSQTTTENSNNDFYACKDETRIEGPWKDTDIEKYIPRQIREIEKLRPWQQMIVDDAKVWNTRTINIIIDKDGNHGKSILKTWIGVHDIGRALPFSNDYKDIMRMVMDTPKKSLYIIDIPRALKKDHLFQFFSGVETLKDGYAYDDRYTFKEEYFDCPNIWIFMNLHPDVECLSRDRWRIWEFDSAGILALRL